ncbi:MAG TPA: ASCH domain-containing protein [Candidatus Microsaccharimonas sp.]
MNEIDIESTMVEAIKNGDKTIEVRLAKPRFLLIQEDDILSVREDFYYEGDVLESLSHALEIKVTQILYFASFKELFDAINFEAVLPSAKTEEDAIATFRKLYSAEDEAEFGVAAFSIEPILPENV